MSMSREQYLKQTTKTRQWIIREFENALKQGEIPWDRGWKNVYHYNYISGKSYLGMNRILLSSIASIRGYKDPRWMTFNQIKKKGWHLVDAKGKGIPVEYYKPYDAEKKEWITWEEYNVLKQELEAGEFQDRIYIRSPSNTTYVFNAELIDGIPEYDQSSMAHFEYGKAKEFLYNYMNNENIELSHFGNSACYLPKADKIKMPLIRQFYKQTFYLDTLVHEIAHSTGHESRLNRDLSGSKGSPKYAKEELRAEISSALINAELGITPDPDNLDRHKAYIQSWISMFEEKPQELIQAISAADSIIDFLKDKGEFEKYIKYPDEEYESEEENEYNSDDELSM